MRSPLFLLAFIPLVGCASTSPKDAFKDTASTVEARAGHSLKWDPEREKADAETARTIDRLIKEELTADSAVKIALLASPKLRATLEELAISQADLVQAGLLKNPSVGFGSTAWEQEHINPNLFATVEQDFLDIVTLPLRKRVARAELEATKLRVADHVLELAADVRGAFYRAQAAEQVVSLRRIVDDAAQTSAELARQQHKAGNMNDLALSTELALAAQTSLDLHRSEGDAAVVRTQLDKLMGTSGPRSSWKLGTRLPEMPAADDETSIDRLETRAVADRLDVAALRGEVKMIAATLTLAKTTRWTGAVSVHVEAGRLRNSKHFSFGPSVMIEIPIFDQRRAAIARLEAVKRQNEAELDGLVVDVRADVRAAHARVKTARTVVNDYGKTLVPARESIVKFSQQQYDAMLLGVYQLIAAKQAELTAYREYIEALRDYWIARSDLERIVGSRIGPPPTITAPPPPPPPPTSHEHHH